MAKEIVVPDIGDFDSVEVIEVLVKVGDTIKKGQTVAKMGTSGRSTGPHVHFEVLLNGRAVNPKKYIHASR